MTRFFQSKIVLLTLTMSAGFLSTLASTTAYAQSATVTTTTTTTTATATKISTEESDTLFQSFGGKAGIDKVVDDLLDIWPADPRISNKLQNADVEHLRMRLKEQFAHLVGGPIEYKGKDMKTIHDGQDLRNVDFNAVVEDLQSAMDKNHIPTRAQNKLLAKLAPMQHDIVTK
jgi:hemoglobin